MSKAQLTLYGVFSLVDANDVDLTPRSNRAKALLAILILTPGATRQRSDLQRLLWNSGEASARMSLRTCLSDVRRNLNKSSTDARHLLQANHKSVWLDTSLIELSTVDTTTGAPFLEGVRVPNKAFQSWAENHANQAEDSDPPIPDALPTDSDRRTIWLRSDLHMPFDITVDKLQSQLLLNLSEQTPVRCVEQADNANASKSAGDAIMEVIPYLTDKEQYFSLKLKSVDVRELLWRGRLESPTQPDKDQSDQDLLMVAHEASEHVLQALRSGKHSENCHVKADHLVGKALRRLFTFVPQKILESKQLLKQAQEIRPHPIQLAWLSTVVMFETIEVPSDNLAAKYEEYQQYADEALTAAPRNAMLLSILSKSKLLIEGDTDAACAMAKEALRINPGLAMAHMSQSFCDSHTGKLSSAMHHAKQGLSLGEHSPMKHWWCMFMSLAQIKSGDFDAAIESAHKALLGAPSFKVPMRHLYALYLFRGQHQQARNILAKLRKLEPDFSLDHVRNNPSFPASTLRTTPLIEQRDVVLNLPPR